MHLRLVPNTPPPGEPTATFPPRPVPNASRLAGALSAAGTQDGTSVAALSDRRPLLLVLLRHFG